MDTFTGIVIFAFEFSYSITANLCGMFGEVSMDSFGGGVEE